MSELISKPKCPFCKKETTNAFVSEFHNYGTGEHKKSFLVVCTNCEVILRCKLISHRKANGTTERGVMQKQLWE